MKIMENDENRRKPLKNNPKPMVFLTFRVSSFWTQDLSDMCFWIFIFWANPHLVEGFQKLKTLENQ